MLTAQANIRLLTSRNILRRFYLNPICIRSVSTGALDPTIRGFVAAFAQKQPYFSMSQRDVHVLSDPNHFYQQLLVSPCHVYLAAEGSVAHRSRFRTWSVAPGSEYLYHLYILAMLIRD